MNIGKVVGRDAANTYTVFVYLVDALVPPPEAERHADRLYREAGELLKEICRTDTNERDQSKQDLLQYNKWYVEYNSFDRDDHPRAIALGLKMLKLQEDFVKKLKQLREVSLFDVLDENFQTRSRMIRAAEKTDHLEKYLEICETMCYGYPAERPDIELVRLICDQAYELYAATTTHNHNGTHAQLRGWKTDLHTLYVDVQRWRVMYEDGWSVREQVAALWDRRSRNSVEAIRMEV